jgi:hypothetical protein
MDTEMVWEFFLNRQQFTNNKSTIMIFTATTEEFVNAILLQ